MKFRLFHSCRQLASRAYSADPSENRSWRYRAVDAHVFVHAPVAQYVDTRRLTCRFSSRLMGLELGDSGFTYSSLLPFSSCLLSPTPSPLQLSPISLSPSSPPPFPSLSSQSSPTSSPLLSISLCPISQPSLPISSSLMPSLPSPI